MFTVLVLTAASLPTFAQISTTTPPPKTTQPTPAVPKIAFINSDAFYDEKVGITRLVNALKILEREFAPTNQQLTSMNTRLVAIATELQNMQKLPPAQLNQAAYNTKREEGERLKREFDYKKTDAESAVAKRRGELIGPISQEIGKAIDEYAKKNGYTVILDSSKLTEAMLFYGEGADSTKDFIVFFNAKTPTAPAAATPR
jgi:Skp family chaperone for outer membrane proteins